MPRMIKAISCWVTSLLLSATFLMGKSEFRTWGVTLDGGWQGSLMLNPKAEEDGVKSGFFFWLFATRDIRWQEDAETITIIYRRHWGPLDENPPKIRFRKDAGSLVPMADGLEADEHKSLAATPWKPGGPDPGQLGGDSDSSTPYSKAHNQTRFILDVSTIPAPLARHALRVFDDDEAHLMPLIRHPGLSSEALNEVWKNAHVDPTGLDSESRPGSILRALASNPSLPKDLLRKLWENSLKADLWAADLPYLASRHPAADPEWYQTVLHKLAEDGEEADQLRSGLEQEPSLPPEVLDLLVKWSAHSGELSSELGHRKDLSQAQIELLFMAGAQSLISREDFPPHLFTKAANSDSFGTHISIIRNPAAPPEITRQVLHRLYERPDFGRINMSGPFDLYVLIAEHRLLPDDLQSKLATHIAPEVRTALAGNPSLSMPIRRQLAADPFAWVARAARNAISKDADADTSAFLASLPAVETLNSAETFNGAARATLEADDPRAFRLYQDALVGTNLDPNDYWSRTMIETGAIRCIQDQVESGKLKTQHLATDAFLKGWTPQMTELALGKSPDPDTVEAFALSIVQKGRVEDFESLEKRNVDLGFIRKSPLVWYAVARRDEVMLKRLASLHADPNILNANEATTPAQLATSMRFMAALDTLPLDAASRAALEAFRKRFPGDPKAAWLGDWTNGKDEFKTLGAHFNPDGTGTLFTAIGMGISIAWVQPKPGRPAFEITCFDEEEKEQPPVIQARIEDLKLILKLGDHDEIFVRPKLQE